MHRLLSLTLKESSNCEIQTWIFFKCCSDQILASRFREFLGKVSVESAARSTRCLKKSVKNSHVMSPNKGESWEVASKIDNSAQHVGASTLASTLTLICRGRGWFLGHGNGANDVFRFVSFWKCYAAVFRSNTSSYRMACRPQCTCWLMAIKLGHNIAHLGRILLALLGVLLPRHNIMHLGGILLALVFGYYDPFNNLPTQHYAPCYNDTTITPEYRLRHTIGFFAERRL